MGSNPIARSKNGRSVPDTYSTERQSIAAELIHFDREWAKLLSLPARRPGGSDEVCIDSAETQRYFVQHGWYTACTATRYQPSLITGPGTHQHLAAGLPIGMRFHSAPVIRIADAMPMQLGHLAKADGRWRIYAFAAKADPFACIGSLCTFLERAARSPIRRHTPASADVDTTIDLRAIFQQHHREVAVDDLPGLLLPIKGRLGLRDYEKAFCADTRAGHDIFDLRDIDRQAGRMVVVRPGQYVAHVLPLDAHTELADFFGSFMRPAQRPLT